MLQLRGIGSPRKPPISKEGKGGAPVEARLEMRRKKDVTMLSCRSCQDTLFMARCDLEAQTCG